MTAEGETAPLRHVAHWKLYLLIAVLVFVVIFVLALNIGYTPISFGTIAKILGKQLGMREILHGTILRAIGDPFPFVGNLIDYSGIRQTTRTIILQIRLPRVICGALVGTALATAGVIYQGIFRNPMADPYVIGAMSGASLGSALVIVLGVGIDILGVNTLQVFAFAGSLATVFFVYTISKSGSRVPVTLLLLTGIAVTYFQSAIVTFLQVIASDKLHGLVFWLIGSLAPTENWTRVGSIIPFIVVGVIIVYFYSRDLNILALGEDQAQYLGVEIEKVKRILIACGALLTAAAVSVSGLIGFVGLIIPHLTRVVIGPDHRFLLPTAAIVGSSFLMICDAVARVVMGSGEAPVGVITAFTGGPFFIYLLRRRKKGYYV